MKVLSQDSYVEGFDLSQAKDKNKRKSKRSKISTPQLVDKEINRAGENAPDAPLVYLREEDWERVSLWSTSASPLRIGPTILDAQMARRLMDPSEWLHNWEIDAVMYLFRERTNLKRWKPNRVAFMTVVFSNMIKKEYASFLGGKRKYTLHNLLLQFGKGVLPPHGRTEEIWNVDVDRLYVPVHVGGNHWIALCISFVTRTIDVFDCSGRKRYKELDAFSHLLPRIVKAVQPSETQKDFTVSPYSVSYVPMGKLNKGACDCGVYTLKFIECHSLGLELSLVNDDNIKEARHRLLWDIWEAANDPELVERMAKYEPPECLVSSAVEEIV